MLLNVFTLAAFDLFLLFVLLVKELNITVLHLNPGSVLIRDGRQVRVGPHAHVKDGGVTPRTTETYKKGHGAVVWSL